MTEFSNPTGQPLHLDEARKPSQAVEPCRDEALVGPADRALRDHVVGDDRPQEGVLLAVRVQRADDAVERVVERCRDRVELRVRQRLNLLDPTLDAEDLGVDAQHGLDVPVLVCHLCREQQADVVVGRGEQEGRQQLSDVELGVEAVRIDPHQPLTGLTVQPGEGDRVDGEVNRQRRPLMALPVLVQRRKRPTPLTQPRGARHPAARLSTHADGGYWMPPRTSQRRFVLIPIVDRMVRVDLRTITLNIPPQEVITKDNVPVRVNAVAYFRIVEPKAAIVQVENFMVATSQIAQTTLRAVLGQHVLDELLSEREKINSILQEIIDGQTAPWGIKVSIVEVKDVEIPSGMQRAMARQAEAERERRAKVINAEGEFQASERLKDAARVIAEEPTALQLRYLQTLLELGSSQATTIVFPVDLIRPFVPKADGSN